MFQADCMAASKACYRIGKFVVLCLPSDGISLRGSRGVPEVFQQ